MQADKGEADNMNHLCIKSCPFFRRIVVLKEVESMFLLDDEEICTLKHDGCRGKHD